MWDFSGQAVMVIGGGTGIGAAVARAFGQAGADVALTYFGSDAGAHATALAVTTAGRRALLRRVDSRQVEELEAFVDAAIREWARIDILVYNSGLTDPQPIFELTEAQWDRTLDINLKGMFFCTRRVAAHLRDRQSPGAVVLLSSVHGTHAMHDHVHYAASKGGINMLTRSLAYQFAPDGIRVNAVAPGSIYVESHRLQQLYDPDAVGRQIPMGRVGTPEEIADVVLYLASPHASYITGQVVSADGGLTLPLALVER
jgi:NAD(P)-dependent dehydrogenase (short-subunit alcohol dehydrogenase family)